MKTLLIFALLGAAAAYCPNSCSGHGDCSDSDVCSCHPYWGGNDCSERQCPFGISWTTATNWDLSMAASPGFHQDTSSSLKGGLHAYTECSSRGQCDRETGKCKCYSGYSGKACRRSSCPNDCSGHGLCALDSAINSAYGDNKLLAPQKQYWNSHKTQSCVCDAGYTGTDCSQRICPQNSDPTSGCVSASDSKDVQLVTIKYNNLASAAAHSVEQFFTLTFTDQFNNRFTTKPLSYFDDPATVQQALMSLPNFAIPDIQVQKIWPDAKYATVTKGTAVTDSSLHKEGLQQAANKHCATAYYKNFMDASCNTKADCVKKFGLASGNVICDTTITDKDNNKQNGVFTTKGLGGKGVCVETDLSVPADKAITTPVCQVADNKADNWQKTIADFDAKDTSSKRTTIDHLCGYSAGTFGNFEPDGIYQSEAASETGYYLGRRLTAYERGCYHGKFDEKTDLMYGKTCGSDADCVKCGGWTSVRAGMCKSGTCVPRNDGNVAYDTKAWIDPTECSRASFVIKFTDEFNSGKQNLMTVQFGSTLSNQPGASPKFPSASLGASNIRIGLPEWVANAKASNSASGLKQLCYASTHPSLATTCSGTKFPLEDGLTSVKSLNELSEDQNGYTTRTTAAGYTASHWFEPHAANAIYTLREITDWRNAQYKAKLPCSKSGSCDTTTGNCKCKSGYLGIDCGKEAKDFK